MYWLQRPPYLRWTAAAILIVGAALWDLRPAQTALHPFLIESVAAGDPVQAAGLEWRNVPVGMIATPDLRYPVAAFDLPAGTPLVDAMLRGPVQIPDGWWSVPVAVGGNARPGDEVLLMVVEPPTTVSGIVTTPQHGDPYSLDYRPASVAVPRDDAPVIAAASARGTLVAAVRPATNSG